MKLDRDYIEELASRSEVVGALWLRARWTKAKLLTFYSDFDYAKRLFAKRGKTWRTDPPVTYNDKLWYLKLSNRDPLLAKCTDKHAVRDYLEDKSLAHILKTEYAHYLSADEINFSELPSPTYLKGSHGSGLNWVYRNDSPSAERLAWLRRFRFLLKQNHYWLSREWNYKNVPPAVVAEEYLQSEDGSPIPELQFFCFEGEPRLIGYNLGLDDRDGQKLDGRSWFFDSEFNLLELTSNNPTADSPPPRPERFEEMLEIARTLAGSFPHVRVDLFNLNGRIIFNELTFYPFGGSIVLEPSEWQPKVGSWLNVDSYSVADDAKRGGVRRVLESLGLLKEIVRA